MNIPDDIAAELAQEIRDLMRQFYHNPQGSDYRCSFCFETSETNMHDVVHKADCSGLKYLLVLEVRDEEGD